MMMMILAWAFIHKAYANTNPGKINRYSVASQNRGTEESSTQNKRF
jgi:hypothetical protein